MSSNNEKNNAQPELPAVITNPDWYRSPETVDPLKFLVALATRHYISSDDASKLTDAIIQIKQLQEKAQED